MLTSIEAGSASILSAEEGSSYASMEYLLAGLGVVSTHSTGGRDVYFDPDYCITCDPTPEAVRDAVAELRARNIPRGRGSGPNPCPHPARGASVSWRWRTG